MSSYEELIDQIYIDPIRSVIAVDDQFPTIDKLLDPQESPIVEQKVGGKVSSLAIVNVNADEIGHAKSLAKCCRQHQWMLDIHDGSKVFEDGATKTILKHLHQTDLLVLDYKLAGEQGAGDKAIDILRALSSNRHFNIVVVYSKEDALHIFHEIALSLLREIEIPCEKQEEIEEFWLEWRDEDPAAAAALQEQIDTGVYLCARRQVTLPSLKELAKSFPNLKAFITDVGAKIRGSDGCTFVANDVGWWLLKKFQKEIRGKFAAEGAYRINVSTPATRDVNWLRTDSLFLTVVHKDVEGEKIIGRLADALHSWQPTPHRLILSLLRAEMEGSGGAIEEAALSDDRLQAGLLRQLISTKDDTRNSHLVSILERHWSQILSEMKKNVLPTAQAITTAESDICEQDADKAVARHYSWYNPDHADQRSTIAAAVNSCLSTQSVDGHHLTTGQVFFYEEAYWICLSPICDLQPDQNSTVRWNAVLGDALPFKAVKLVPITKLSTALNYATTSLCLFLDIDGEMQFFGFVALGGENDDLNPHWEQMFAANQGALMKSMS